MLPWKPFPTVAPIYTTCAQLIAHTVPHPTAITTNFPLETNLRLKSCASREELQWWNAILHPTSATRWECSSLPSLAVPFCPRPSRLEPPWQSRVCVKSDALTMVTSVSNLQTCPENERNRTFDDPWTNTCPLWFILGISFKCLSLYFLVTL